MVALKCGKKSESCMFLFVFIKVNLVQNMDFSLDYILRSSGVLKSQNWTFKSTHLCKFLNVGRG